MKCLTIYAFYVLLLVVAVYLAFLVRGVRLSELGSIRYFLIGLPVLLVTSHIVTTLSVRRGIFFVTLAAAVGFLMEKSGLQWGTIFGGHYLYTGHVLSLADVPVSVILYWAVFIYTGYSIVNSWLCARHREKPNLKNRHWKELPLLILLDASVVTAIDLFMDPIQVKNGAWVWLDGGSYFGVPIGNFIGWFSVVIIGTGLYRLFEYFYPRPEVNDIFILNMPVISYGLLFVSLVLSSLRMQLYSLIPFGVLFMAPVLITSVLLFINYNLISPRLCRAALCRKVRKPSVSVTFE